MEPESVPSWSELPTVEAKPFDEAAKQLVADLAAALAEIEALADELPDSAYTEEEWTVIQAAFRDAEEYAERADEGYVAVRYDSHAWYRIMESQQQLLYRLQSAAGVMRRVKERLGGAPPET